MNDASYERPITTVDAVVFTLKNDLLHVLLIRRHEEPKAGWWALPGGWVHTHEDKTLDDSVRRVLLQKTGVASPYFEQLGTLGSLGRDPRRWSISIAYVSLMPWENVCLAEPGTGADELAWVPVETLDRTTLAFDHGAILDMALDRLCNKVNYSSLPAHLLPQRFTLTQLQQVYERVLNARLDKSAFRKKVAEADFLVETSEKLQGRHRPATLYTLRHDVYFRRNLT